MVGGVGSLYEMSSDRHLDLAQFALGRAGITARGTRARVAGTGPWLGVRHRDAQTDEVREIVLRADGAARQC
jgi:hypothetical protein